MIDGPIGPTATGGLVAAPFDEPLAFWPKWVNVVGPPCGLIVCVNVLVNWGESVTAVWNRPGGTGGGVIQTVPRSFVPLFKGVSFADTLGASRGVIGSEVSPLATVRLLSVEKRSVVT